MPKTPQPSDKPNQTEEPLQTFLFRQCTGVDMTSARTDIADDKAFYLENVMPLGDGKIRVLPNIGPLLYDFFETIYASRGLNLNGVEYLIAFGVSGKVYLYNFATATATILNETQPLSGVGSWCDQWKNSTILFIDSTGYYSYDGTTFLKQSGQTGVPSYGDNIAVYDDRVWITQGRSLIVSGANGYDSGQTDGTNYWLPENGSEVSELIDPAIRSNITRMAQSNGLLYLFHSSGINVISNVTVPVGADPPTPIWDNVNVQAAIGSDQPYSIVGYDRFNLFASRNGAYMMYGLAAPQLSDAILGMWQYVDFTQAISGGQVNIFSQLCAAFLVKRAGDPDLPDATVVALWFSRNNKDRWFFANFGALTAIVTSWVGSLAVLYGFIGSKLYQLFAPGQTPPDTLVMTKLYGLEDPIQRKEVMHAGVFIDINTVGQSITLSTQTENDEFTADVTAQAASAKTLLLSTSTPSLNGRAVGFSLETSGYDYDLHFFAADYKLRQRWGQP